MCYTCSHMYLHMCVLWCLDHSQRSSGTPCLCTQGSLSGGAGESCGDASCTQILDLAQQALSVVSVFLITWGTHQPTSRFYARECPRGSILMTQFPCLQVGVPRMGTFDQPFLTLALFLFPFSIEELMSLIAHEFIL